MRKNGDYNDTQLIPLGIKPKTQQNLIPSAGRRQICMFAVKFPNLLDRPLWIVDQNSQLAVQEHDGSQN
jgi:hypothetical protein